MKFFKNKFFIIVMSLALFIVIFAVTLSAMGQTGPINNTLNIVATPFRYVGLKIGEAFHGFSKYFTSIDELDKENQSLIDEIERLEGELADSQAIKEENERLREYIEFKKTYPNLALTEALIISSESENHSTIFTLNKGREDGINVGMPVVISKGVVGSVCEIGSTWCKVRVITEASSSIGAYVSRSGEIGLIEGDISLKNTGECILNYLPADADIEIGDLIYTSGLGSVYPRGLLIGEVTDIKTDEYLRAKIARVRCAVNFDSLTYVMIVTDYDIHVEE
ncbi:MAG: rod shape-determining protein MreC [Clostridia bacterium]|nr:rod shape-determining protein MreC [Clostridia bacterium]